MYFYSQISCKAVGKVLYNSTFKGRENGPKYLLVQIKVQSDYCELTLDNHLFNHDHGQK